MTITPGTPAAATMSDYCFLAGNLAALRSWSPATAGMLEATVVPVEWQRTVGSDGTPTFARRTAERVDWLGQTSMPVASAVPLTVTMNLQSGSSSDGGGGNGLGLGIGTGYEWRHLASRLGPQQVLFVLDDDAVAMRLALTMCDLSDVLGSGRVVLLLDGVAGQGPWASEQLLNFLTSHAGFEPPTVLHPLSTLSAARRNTLISLGEGMVRLAVQRRAEATVELAKTLMASPPKAVAGALLALPLMERSFWDGALPAALGEVSGRPVRVLALDRPESASPLVRLQAIQEQAPEMVWSDVFRSHLNLPLGEDVSVHTWVPPAAGLAYWQQERFPTTELQERDRVIVQSWAHQRLLEKLDFRRGQITLVPPAVGPVQDAGKAPAGGMAFPSAIALIADLPSLDPEVYGLTLPSHVALWQALRALIAESPLTHILEMHPDMVPDLLRRGQARANVAINEPTLLESLSRGLEHVLLPAAALLGLARHLDEAGLPLKFIGSNFLREAFPRATLAEIPRQATFCDAAVAEIFSDVALALQFTPDASFHAMYLYAPLYHVPLVCPAHPWHGHPGTLPKLLAPNTELLCPAAGQLIPTLKAALRNPVMRRALATAAAEHIVAEHTWAKRVTGLLAEGK